MELTRFLFDGLRGQTGPFGGRYIPGEVIFTAHELCGAHVGATPDGRLRGEVLADSAGSSQGMNRNGPTALLNSVRKLPTEEMVTSIVVNLKFHRAFFEKHQEEAAALLRAYFRGGGQQVQVNVCDKEELKDCLFYTSVDEAAMIDGCGPIRTFYQIIMPMMSPIIATTLVLTVLGVWNDFTLPLVVLQKDKTLPLFIYNYRIKYITNFNLAFRCV